MINEIKHKIAELENQIQVLSMEDLHSEIGHPDEIARGFECREDIDKLKEKAKKYFKIKIISWICLIVAMIAIAVSVIIIKSNKTYYSETKSQSCYIKETK